jgi:hypothetical protein
MKCRTIRVVVQMMPVHIEINRFSLVGAAIARPPHESHRRK